MTNKAYFRIALFAAAAIAGMIFPCAAQNVSTNPPAMPRKPSIIFILADDLGYGDLGCYGQKNIKTPNLDKMAEEGRRFTSFYAGSTVCAPSRCALMTGKHSGHGEIRGNKKGLVLSAEATTVAEILKQAGYRNGCIGKWGLGNEGSTGLPELKGFDDVLCYLDHVHAHDYYTDHLYRHDPPNAANAGFSGRIILSENQDGKKNTYTHDLFTTAALNFIKNNKPEQFKKFRPFFLYLAYTIPHANNEAYKLTGNGMQVPSDQPYSDEKWPQIEKNKAAMITRMDADIGKIMDKLKELRIDDNTIILFSSDNGSHKEGGVDPKFHNSGGPLRGNKRDLYEGGIRVPMIVRWPIRIKPGVENSPWAFWDVMPTLAEIANVKSPEKIDGISFAPTLFGRAQTNRHDFFYWEFHERGFQQASRMGDWKAVRPQAGEPLEIYNLKNDLGEKTNVAAANPEIVAKFEAYFKTARTEDDRWPIKPPPENKADKTKTETKK